MGFRPAPVASLPAAGSPANPHCRLHTPVSPTGKPTAAAAAGSCPRKLRTQRDTEMTGTNLPRAYVADLAACSVAKLHGAWIDATQDVEAMEEDVQAMLAASPVPIATEHAFHDTEGFERAKVDEWASLQAVHDLALLIVEHGRIGAALVTYCDDDVDEASHLLDDGCFLGVWENTADYTQDLMEQTAEIPYHLATYIDYQAVARDMELNGDILAIVIDGETHVFMSS